MDKKLFFIITIIVVIALLFFMKSSISNNMYDPYVFSFKDLKDIQGATDSTTRPRIAVFNSYAYPNGKIPRYASISNAINKLYCEKHGYDYIQSENEISDLPPYWMRVNDAYNIMKSDKYDVIVYLDLDAVFFDFSTPIEAFLNNDYNIYIGRDPPNGITNDFNNLVNTGCFIIKNNDWSRGFMREWLNACVDDDSSIAGVCKNDWNFNGKKWNCKDCKWAGIKYEQGMFANLYLSNIKNSQKYVCLLNEHVFVDDFVLHLMSESDVKREHIFENLLKNLVSSESGTDKIEHV